jgi:hypothetical protein
MSGALPWNIIVICRYRKLKDLSPNPIPADGNSFDHFMFSRPEPDPRYVIRIMNFGSIFLADRVNTM